MTVIKKISILVGIIAAIMIVLSGLYGFQMMSETKKMRPNDTKEIVAGIYTIRDDYVNMYLIKTADRYVAIDMATNPNNVAKEMAKLNIAPEKVSAVLLTHTDYDHIGAIKLFKNAHIYISTAEEQMINGKTARSAFIMKNKLNGAYQKLEDNQVVDIAGLKVRGISTPGHTPGSMCYIINDRYLFTGDTLSLKSQKADLFNEFFNMDSATEAKSIHKLAALTGIKLLFTAHYGYTDNFQKALEDWKSQR